MKVSDTSLVNDNCYILPETVIHNFCNIYNKSFIGMNCNIGSYVEISGAVIGNNVSVGAYSFIPQGVEIADNVRIGPNVHFTHEFPPRERGDWAPIYVDEGAMIGTGAIIMPGVTIGKNAIIGAGAVVTKSVPDGETWAGVPARRIKPRE